ncbi:MAG: hypothetical protein KC501_17320 [Myxococcales bacterium]|nr:hypothetical protein [Myxococcales bacterium]
MDELTVLPKIVTQLATETLEGSAETTPELRRAVADRAASITGEQRDAGSIPPPLLSLVDKVARCAYKITDEDFERLREAGYGEDQLFELVVAAALGASLGRFERGLQVMRAARAGR